jgi:adenine-specific DNA methylase
LVVAEKAAAHVDQIFVHVPFGVPEEPTPKGGGTGAGRAFSVQGYGMMRWRDLFTPRQLVALGTFVSCTSQARSHMLDLEYPLDWIGAVHGYLALGVDRLADRSSTICRPDPTPTQSGIINTFSRFALPITWDFIEGTTTNVGSGGYLHSLEWIARFCDTVLAFQNSPCPDVRRQSAIRALGHEYDIVVTDPPYYDAIPYSDLMDFFYIWLRRSVYGLSAEVDAEFQQALAPKWNHNATDGELIDDSSRHGNDALRSKIVYEDGMARAFQQCAIALKPAGRLVIVFANKQPDAWETLVSAIVRAGFVVDGSWPIQTEMENRTRAQGSAALASSVWLVCKKRSEDARPGWDNTVLQEMRARITEQLRAFWDAGIEGPNFVWAATGPAMESFSKHPFVKKADRPGETMSVSEFLRAVRRIVVDFVVGRVLSEATGTEADSETTTTLDDVTTYYLLHRHDFGMDDAPAGACILYAVSCDLSESDLADKYDLLVRSGGVDKNDDGEPDEGDADAEGEATEGTGSTFKLKAWKQRKRPGMGVDPLADAARSRRLREEAQPRLFERAEPVESAPAAPKMMPLIDQVHRLMHLWKAGDQVKVDQYLEDRGLRRSELFKQLLQALIELSPEGSEERSVLESISNHVQARGVKAKSDQQVFVQIVEGEQE